jgi:phosphate starvation-inducible membrane PsiE
LAKGKIDMTDAAGPIEKAHRKFHKLADRLGTGLVRGFHLLALFAIGATIVWAAVFEFFKMAAQGGIYFTTNHMPVRFLIYVALTALTRLLIGMVNLEHVDLMNAIQTPHLGLLVVTGCILMLAAAVLVLRYASYKYPSVRTASEGSAGGAEDMP